MKPVSLLITMPELRYGNIAAINSWSKYGPNSLSRLLVKKYFSAWHVHSPHGRCQRHAWHPCNVVIQPQLADGEPMRILRSSPGLADKWVGEASSLQYLRGPWFFDSWFLVPFRFLQSQLLHQPRQVLVHMWCLNHPCIVGLIGYSRALLHRIPKRC